MVVAVTTVRSGQLVKWVWELESVAVGDGLYIGAVGKQVSKGEP